MGNKKRKLDQNGTSSSDGADTTKPSAVFVPQGGRKSTLSIAIPGSFITNAVSHDQKNNLCGSIARALAVFSVDEVVIFKDTEPSPSSNKKNFEGNQRGYSGYDDPEHFLTHLLSYLETPPYLRRRLFPMHPDLKTAGSLPSLDMPHHSKFLEGCPYREGVTNPTDRDGNTPVDVGLQDLIYLPSVTIPPNTRVTIHHSSEADESTPPSAVSPAQPREEMGYYWGYSIRSAPSLSSVFTESPFENGYDLSIGTSERGDSLSSVLPSIIPSSSSDAPTYEHTILIFGGPTGLETAANADKTLKSKGITGSNVSELFDSWVNVLPGQGSRTIRTEEAVWLGLMGTREIVVRNNEGSFES